MFSRKDAVGRRNVIKACHYLIEDGQSLRVKPVGAGRSGLVVSFAVTKP